MVPDRSIIPIFTPCRELCKNALWIAIQKRNSIEIPGSFEFADKLRLVFAVHLGQQRDELILLRMFDIGVSIYNDGDDAKHPHFVGEILGGDVKVVLCTTRNYDGKQCQKQ